MIQEITEVIEYCPNRERYCLAGADGDAIAGWRLKNFQPPRQRYSVTYRLDPEGELIAQLGFNAMLVNTPIGLVECCFLPEVWHGFRLTRTVEKATP